jgi:hypothetical protein
MLYEFSDDSLATAFADKESEGDYIYISTRGGWFVRDVDADGKTVWRHDYRLRVWIAIRGFLSRVAAGHPNANLSQRLGSAETIKAVEFLARQDLASSEEDLAPGA